MHLDDFQDRYSDEEKEVISKLEDNKEDVLDLEFLPSNMAKIEQELNGKFSRFKDMFNVKGFILEPIRRQDQIMYKPTINKPAYKHFTQEQDQNKLIFDEHFPLIDRRIESNSKEEYMFITIELLRRSPYSNYFMYLPDAIFLNLPDYYHRIKRPIDMYTIGNNILKHSYSTKDDFETDVVTMINNFKIYFMGNHELFGIAIKFQMLFWQIYEEQQKKYKIARKQYRQNIQKPLRAPAVRKLKTAVKKYTTHEKRVLNKRLRDLQKSNANHFNEVIKYIIESCKAKIQKGKINIEDLKNEHCQEIQKMFGQFELQDKELEIQMNNVQHFRVERHQQFIQALRMDDIVGASEDEESS